ELIEQHRVDGIVAYRIDVAVLVMHSQVRIHRGHFFRDQSKLQCTGLVTLVVKRHWLKCEKRFAHFVHRLNFILDVPRRTCRDKVTAIGYDDRQCGAALCRYAINTGDPGRPTHVRTTGITTDTGNITGCRYVCPSPQSQGCITTANRVVHECNITDGCV